MRKILIFISVLILLLFFLFIVWWTLIHTKPGYDNITVHGYLKDKSKPIVGVNIKITYWTYNDNYIPIDSTRFLRTNDKGYYETFINNADAIDVEAFYNGDTLVDYADFHKGTQVRIDFNFLNK